MSKIFVANLQTLFKLPILRHHPICILHNADTFLWHNYVTGTRGKKIFHAKLYQLQIPTSKALADIAISLMDSHAVIEKRGP